MQWSIQVSSLVVEKLVSKLVDILRIPIFRVDVVGECRRNIFYREYVMSCERTQEMWRRTEDISVVECEINE